jgi:hypothetical protein
VAIEAPCGSWLASDEAYGFNTFLMPEMQNANPKVGVLFSSSAD